MKLSRRAFLTSVAAAAVAPVAATRTLEASPYIVRDLSYDRAGRYVIEHKLPSSAEMIRRVMHRPPGQRRPLSGVYGLGDRGPALFKQLSPTAKACTCVTRHGDILIDYAAVEKRVTS